MAIDIEILTIGNELLNGDLADTNTQRLAALLRQLGLPVRRAQTVPDTMPMIVEAMRVAAARSEVVLVSGGLGPTEDDLTLEAAALAAGVRLVEHEGTIARLRERFKSRGFPLTPNNLRQARVPEGADVFDNPVGTAPHVQLVLGRARLFLFPGVPMELARLAEDFLVPWLRAHAPVVQYRSKVFKTFGKTESQVATLLESLPRDGRMHVAYRAHFPEIQVSLHVEEPEPTAAESLLASSAAHVREALGDIIYGESAGDTLPAAVGALLAARGETVALAESCTGGLVAKMLTDVAGSSRYFVEGFVTYANEAKESMLGVNKKLLLQHGAVSEPVVRAMAENVRKKLGATFALSISGVAGPGGGTEAKPVGTTYVALSNRERTRTMHQVLLGSQGSRDQNRILAAHLALDALRTELLGIHETGIPVN